MRSVIKTHDVLPFIIIFLLTCCVTSVAQTDSKLVKQFVVETRDKIVKNKIDPSRPFGITVEVTFTEDGKLDRNKTRLAFKTGDERLAQLAVEGIAVLGQARYLANFNLVGSQQSLITVIQDDKSLSFAIEEAFRTERRANSAAQALSAWLNFAAMALSNRPADKLIKQELVLIRSFVISNSKQTLRAKCVMTAASINDLLDAYIL